MTDYKCNRCSVRKSRACFGTLIQDYRDAKAGDRQKTCLNCLERQLSRHREKQAVAANELSRRARGSSLLPFKAFLDQVRSYRIPTSGPDTTPASCDEGGAPWTFQVKVNLSDTVAEKDEAIDVDDLNLEALLENRNQRANTVADMIWDALDYRFV